MKRIRIFLIDDNRILREGIAALINAQPDMRVVAVTDGHTSPLQLATESNPHVLLKDLGIRNINVVQVLKSLTKKLPKVKVIGMGLIPTQSDIVEFVEAGAAGFILKDAKITEFLGAIRNVARGEKVLPPALTGSLFSHVIEHAVRNRKGNLDSAVRMTKRERETVALIADGMSNKEIAQRLNIATYTVKSHVHNILEKLALHSRLQISARFQGDEPA